MHIFGRTALSTIGGACAAAALGVLMTQLIRAEFTPQQKRAAEPMEINPQMEEPPVVRRMTKVPEVKKVDVPPSPPEPDYLTTTKPIEKPIEKDSIPDDWTPPDLGDGMPIITVADKNATPLLRVAGQMPPRATRSGHCVMRFDVGTDGAPFNINAMHCTENLFERPSVKATSKFKYNPKIQDGVAVTMTGVETSIRYRLLDENGNVIPE